jgi:Flp pilus assembly protein TadG
MTATNLPTKRSGFLTRLMQDQSGNTLALVAAAVFPIIAIVGGAVDIGRGYLVKARLQQACDAGALTVRKAMSNAVLNDTHRQAGYSYFDFNFPSGSYGTISRTRAYSQPVTNDPVPVPLPRIDGTATAVINTTLMRVFGRKTMTIDVACQSEQEVSHADVAMVLDITGSMNGQMSTTDTTKRIAALRQAVKAFYQSLGPGRAGGSPTAGRIRYAVVPYGRIANVGFLLNHDQMVDSHVYSSRQPGSLTSTVNAWTDGTVTTGIWGTATPSSPSPLTEIDKSGNYSSWTDVSGTGDYAYTKLNGASGTIAKLVTAADQNACLDKNNYPSGKNKGLVAVSRGTSSDADTPDAGAVAPIHPAATRTLSYTRTKTWNTNGIRYAWKSGPKTCVLQTGNGNNKVRWNQTQSRSDSIQVIWTAHLSSNYQYLDRTIDVSGLKSMLGGWNSSFSVPNIDLPAQAVTLSGSLLPTQIGTGAGIARTIPWLGCVEERRMDNTITGTTPLTSIPVNAIDLNVKISSSSSDDNTRWRPYLPDIFYARDGRWGYEMPDSDYNLCPAPAFKLQEIANYSSAILDFENPVVFDNTDNGINESAWYPYVAPSASNPNLATFENYINRIALTPGTAHEPGFIWGLHLLSGQGMFGSENPSFFESSPVSRHLVFMTDGEVNPGEDKYSFSGFNMQDGRLAPASTSDPDMKTIQNRRLRIMCEEAKRQGITVWVVVIKAGVSNDADLKACASSTSQFKSAASTTELINSFTAIAQSIGGLRLSQ